MSSERKIAELEKKISELMTELQTIRAEKSDDGGCHANCDSKYDSVIKKIVIKFNEKGQYLDIPFAKRALVNPPKQCGNTMLNAFHINKAYVSKDDMHMLIDLGAIYRYMNRCSAAENFTEIEYEVDPNLYFSAEYTIWYITINKNQYITFKCFCRMLQHILESSVFKAIWDKFITFTPTGFRLRVPVV
jgi:hypothetical protein